MGVLSLMDMGIITTTWGETEALTPNGIREIKASTFCWEIEATTMDVIWETEASTIDPIWETKALTIGVAQDTRASTIDVVWETEASFI